jgi:2-dehydropantoate 2-reductase
LVVDREGTKDEEPRVSDQRIAVMGAGSMGTMLGAGLTRAGLTVDLVDVDREHVDALNARGATVVGTVSWSVPVHAVTPREMHGDYDLVFLLVKQTHNEAAFAQLGAHLNAGSIVCTLQNGIPEPAVAAALGVDRTLGAAVTWAGTFLSPGVVESTALPEKWRALLGTADGRVSEAAAGVRSVLSVMCPTEFVADLAGIRWSKLLVNASFSGMSAALGCTFGEILDNEKAFKCAQYMARECIRVASAQGIELAHIWPGVDFKERMDFDTEQERRATSEIYRELWGAVRFGKASMLQDIENGRKSEIGFINGLLSETGRRSGVPTPVSDTVVRIVRGVEDGQLALGLDNLDLFAACE